MPEDMLTGVSSPLTESDMYKRDQSVHLGDTVVRYTNKLDNFLGFPLDSVLFQPSYRVTVKDSRDRNWHDSKGLLHVIFISGLRFACF